MSVRNLADVVSGQTRCVMHLYLVVAATHFLGCWTRMLLWSGSAREHCTTKQRDSDDYPAAKVHLRRY